MLSETVTKDFEKWMDQDWPLWRQNPDTHIIYRLRRTYEAAYFQGRQDEADTVSACLV